MTTNSAHMKKFENLILYVCNLCSGDAAFGSVKLNKLLYFIDFGFYLKHGRPLSGHQYVKLEHGPAPRNMTQILERMDRKGRILEQKTRMPNGYKLNRHIACEQADANQFSGEEIDHIRETVREYAHLSASALSTLSHFETGYQATKLQEVIPYATFYFRPYITVTESDKEITKKLSKKFKWHDRYAATAS